MVVVFTILDKINLWERYGNSGFFDYRVYDRAAIKFQGVNADINFNISYYDDDIKQVESKSPM